MNTPTLASFFVQQQETILNEWAKRIETVWQARNSSIDAQQLSRQCRMLLNEIIRVLPDFKDTDHWEPEASSDLIAQLNQMGVSWAVKGFLVSDTSSFILNLKYVVIEGLCQDPAIDCAQQISLIRILEKLSDRLLVICHEAYIQGRERYIKQQSQALLELSSPVVKLWQNMLLLPLIGVIDTRRARQITESLLSEIARQEALVTIIDLTGVPVFDTAVAGHLMKTVKAAQMLGCEVIMTGISPEGALVLTKLGIDFSRVVTRGNLHSGVREGFRKLKCPVPTQAEVDVHHGV